MEIRERILSSRGRPMARFTLRGLIVAVAVIAVSLGAVVRIREVREARRLRRERQGVCALILGARELDHRMRAHVHRGLANAFRQGLRSAARGDPAEFTDYEAILAWHERGAAFEGRAAAFYRRLLLEWSDELLPLPPDLGAEQEALAREKHRFEEEGTRINKTYQKYSYFSPDSY